MDPDHEGTCSQAVTTNIIDLVNAYYVLCSGQSTVEIEKKGTDEFSAIWRQVTHQQPKYRLRGNSQGKTRTAQRDGMMQLRRIAWASITLRTLLARSGGAWDPGFTVD